MKIHEIIVEREISPYQFTSYEEKHAVSLLKEHCSTALKIFKTPIWRGFRNHQNDVVFKASPSTGVRSSQNTTNFFNSLLDSSPYMRGWPKRGASFVCTTDSEYAVEYGTAFAIFPINSSKVAVCPEYDIWCTNIVIPEFDIAFEEGEDNVQNFNKWLWSSNSLDLPHTANWMNIASKLPSVIELCEKHNQSPDDFIPILYNALKPENTQFQLMSIDEFVKSNIPGTKRECWVGDDVIAISYAIWKNIKKKL